MSGLANSYNGSGGSYSNSSPGFMSGDKFIPPAQQYQPSASSAMMAQIMPYIIQMMMGGGMMGMGSGSIDQMGIGKALPNMYRYGQYGMPTAQSELGLYQAAQAAPELSASKFMVQDMEDAARKARAESDWRDSVATPAVHNQLRDKGLMMDGKYYGVGGPGFNSTASQVGNNVYKQEPDYSGLGNGILGNPKVGW